MQGCPRLLEYEMKGIYICFQYRNIKKVKHGFKLAETLQFAPRNFIKGSQQGYFTSPQGIPVAP